MKTMLIAFFIALGSSSAFAITPAHYSCASSKVSSAFVLLKNGEEEIVIARDIESRDWSPMKYITIYGTAQGDERYVKAFSTSKVGSEIIDSEINAIFIPESMLKLKTKKSNIQLVTYNNASKYDYVTKSVSLSCELVPLKY